ncbi:MAG TPA: protein kinase [Gemmatimonadales bacterium]|nr:protein kinase [Gemmatimonadales bacterium]
MLERLSQALAGRYLIERQLGRGGMASVWLARDLRLDRAVAIKVLHPELAGAIGAERFIREIHLTVRLEHPSIVPVLDSGIVDGPGDIVLPWYSMVYVPGESLRARLAREGSLPVEEAVHLAREAAAALATAHRAGIVHRDIKPENLLLAEGRLYVADFGIAKALMDTGGERLTSTGFAIGTPMYMSPEQASAAPVDARSDQYSLGCVLYEMLAGEPPFTGPTAQAIVARRMTEPPRSIRAVRPAVPESVEAAVLKALAPIPADRYPDIASFAAALARPVPAARPGRPAVAWLAAGVLLVAAIGFGARRGNRHPAGVSVSRDSIAVALYQRGLHDAAKRTPGGVRAAVQALNDAVARDSSFTEAWGALARTYVRAYGRHFDLSGIASDSVLRLAVMASDRALAGDRRSSSAWLTQALVTRMVEPTDVAPTLRAVREALALDSSNAEAWHALALTLAESGEMDSALQAWRRSVAADPSYAEGIAFLALGHYWRHQYDSAERWADSVVAMEPSFLLGRGTAGYIAIERGEYARGVAQFEAARRLTTDVELVNALAGKALAQARGGAVREARATLHLADSLAGAFAPEPSHSALFLAQAWAALGETDRAIAWLRRYQPSDDTHFQLHLRCDPPFGPVAQDPRFRKLLRGTRPPGSAGC